MRRLACTIIVILSFCLGLAQAQVSTGTVVGTIRDASGGAIVGVRVSVTETSKGTVQTTATDQNGDYNVQFLIPGVYRVQAEANGFKRQSSSDVTVEVNGKPRLDFVLQVGDVTASVEISATAALVQTESSELGQVIPERQLKELPLNGRNFVQLIYLVPGVTTGQAGENLSGNSTYNPRAASDFNALGSQATANAWVIDGITDSEYTFNTVMIQASLESIQEFKALTGTFSAEFGRGAAVVSVSTKSGSNDFHGAGFEFVRNNDFDARNFFNARPAVQPPFRRNQYGGSMGGRIKKNKLFFFADYYGERQIQGNTFTNSVPTAQERTGDFSDWKSANGNLIQIYNPFNQTVVNGTVVRAPFPGNLVPASMINPVSANVISLYPLPNASGTQNNYLATLNRILADNGGNARLDYRIGDKDNAFARFSFEEFTLFDYKGQSGCCIPTPPAAAAKFDLGPFVSGGQNTDLKASGLALNETHIFSEHLVNELMVGYSRTNPYTVPSDWGHNSATSLGIQGINLSLNQSGLPAMSITNYTALNGGPGILPVRPVETAIQIGDTVSWTRSRHQLKFGFRYVRNRVSPFAQLANPGNMSFGTNYTNDPGTATGGNGLATLMLGYLTSDSRTFLSVPYYMVNKENSFFVQDDWKVDTHLTLNLGVRYEIYNPDTETYDHMTNFNWNCLCLVYASQNGLGRTVGVTTQYGNIGPRIGFAWDAAKANLVVRGGYGMVYFPQGVSGSQYMGNEIPWITSQNSNPTTYPTSFTGIPQINQPFPAPTVVQPVTTADLNAANPTTYGHDFLNLTPYYESWSLDVQRQLTSSTVVELDYAGSRGIHLEYCYAINEVEPGPGTTTSRRLIQPLSGDANLNQCSPRSMSNFHSGQAKLNRTLSKGFSVLVSYTFGKSLDYGGAAGNPGMGGDPAAQTITNFKAGYAPSGYDTKHRFVTSWLLELPFGKDKPLVRTGVGAMILGGWAVHGIVTFQTGNPFTLTLANGVNNGAPSWPNRIASGVSSHPDPYQWYDPTAFVAPPAYTYGNSARGVLYGPGLRNLDTAISRTFSIAEKVRLKFRLDCFNLSNTPHFALPATSINPAAAVGVVGRITSTVIDNREMQASIRIEF